VLDGEAHRAEHVEEPAPGGEGEGGGGGSTIVMCGGPRRG
jgi:hypothetical protein